MTLRVEVVALLHRACPAVARSLRRAPATLSAEAKEAYTAFFNAMSEQPKLTYWAVGALWLGVRLGSAGSETHWIVLVAWGIWVIVAAVTVWACAPKPKRRWEGTLLGRHLKNVRKRSGSVVGFAATAVVLYFVNRTLDAKPSVASAIEIFWWITAIAIGGVLFAFVIGIYSDAQRLSREQKRTLRERLRGSGGSQNPGPALRWVETLSIDLAMTWHGAIVTVTSVVLAAYGFSSVATAPQGPAH